MFSFSFFLPTDSETRLLVDSQQRGRQCNKGHLFLCKPYISKVTEERSEDGGSVRTEPGVEEEKRRRRRSKKSAGRRGGGACMLFMKTSDSTLSPSLEKKKITKSTMMKH